ncbi:DNase I-like protein [Periconia macrospinosa]|uniref:DNase I-like protein n=1 Tax=Periconia macrospinosa TaxID=97972 RepID=A0A2V1DTD0_9PLEO|nr:DNase I-like protein [Periconia macrospinosa]
MRFFLSVIPFTLLTTLSSFVVADADGKLSFSGDADKYKFTYSTGSAKEKNWIGIYHTTGGPDDEKAYSPSLRWTYAPKGEGSVEIDAPVRASGEFKAYFLADDGYKHLAKPIKFTPKSKVQNTDELAVMTYNLWHGGTKVNDYHKKQVKFIIDSGADIVGLQEATGDHAKRLGEALGWNWAQDDGQDTTGIISRHPITKNHKKIMQRSNGVVINVNGTDEMNFWSMHTTADEYGPYEFCFDGKNGDQVMGTEKKGHRIQETADVLKSTEAQRKEKKPFILVGDFNSPSHLDWVDSTKSKHCGVTFKWPITKACTDAGLTDSYRAIHKDPAKDDGNTWSPIELHNEKANKDEPQDRIDFIFHQGDLKVQSSWTKLVGKPKPKPDEKENEWTSDHRAVITTYTF